MRLFRIASVVLLAFLSLGAFVGSIPMIFDPSGRTMRLPSSSLRYSPFHSFLIPGLILFVANGILALVVLWMVWKRMPHYGLWTALQGCVLLGWLVVECWMLRVVAWPHYFYGVVALGLIVAGLAIEREPVTCPRPSARRAERRWWRES